MRLQSYIEGFQKPKDMNRADRQIRVKIAKAKSKKRQGARDTKKDKEKAAREVQGTQQSQRRMEESLIRKAYLAANPDAHAKFFHFINDKTQRKTEKGKAEQTQDRRACKVEKRKREGRIPWLPDDSPGTKFIVEGDIDVKME